MWGQPAFGSAGVDYERILNQRASVGFLVKTGFIRRFEDSGSKSFKTIIPEIHWLLSQKSLNSAFLTTFFVEISNVIHKPDGSEQSPTSTYINTKTLLFAPGILLGKNIQFSEKCFLSLYIGLKYKFEKDTVSNLINNEKVIEVTHSSSFGYRIGYKFGFRF